MTERVQQQQQDNGHREARRPSFSSLQQSCGDAGAIFTWSTSNRHLCDSLMRFSVCYSGHKLFSHCASTYGGEKEGQRKRETQRETCLCGSCILSYHKWLERHRRDKLPQTISFFLFHKFFLLEHWVECRSIWSKDENRELKNKKSSKEMIPKTQENLQ